MPDQHADAEENEVRRRAGRNLVANLRLDAVEVFRAAGEMQFVAGLQFEGAENGQIQTHALGRSQKDPVARLDVDVIVERADRAAAQRFVGENDLAAFLNELKRRRSDDFAAELGRQRLQDFDGSSQRDLVAGQERRRVGDLNRLAFAEDRLDGGVGELLVDRQNRLADERAIRREFINAGRDGAQRIVLAGIEFGSAARQRFGELHRLLADVPFHHEREKPGHHDDGAQRSEDVTNGVADGDVGLHRLRQFGREAQFRDRVAGRSDDRRLRQAAGGEAGRHAAIESEHPCGREHAQQPDQTHRERRDQLRQRSQIERVEELRPALKPDGVDEERKEHRLDPAVDADVELPDDDADNQRSGDAAQNETADAQFADEVAKRNRRKQREQGFGLEQLVQENHEDVPGGHVTRRIGRRREDGERPRRV